MVFIKLSYLQGTNHYLGHPRAEVSGWTLPNSICMCKPSSSRDQSLSRTWLGQSTREQSSSVHPSPPESSPVHTQPQPQSAQELPSKTRSSRDIPGIRDTGLRVQLHVIYPTSASTFKSTYHKGLIGPGKYTAKLTDFLRPKYKWVLFFIFNSFHFEK